MAAVLAHEAHGLTPEENELLVKEEIQQHGSGWCGGRCSIFSRVKYHHERVGKGRTTNEVKLDFWSCHTLETPPLEKTL